MKQNLQEKNEMIEVKKERKKGSLWTQPHKKWPHTHTHTFLLTRFSTKSINCKPKTFFFSNWRKKCEQRAQCTQKQQYTNPRIISEYVLRLFFSFHFFRYKVSHHAKCCVCTRCISEIFTICEIRTCSFRLCRQPNIFFLAHSCYPSRSVAPLTLFPLCHEFS